MNIIFLDIDGVICTPRACIAVGDSGILGYFDPIALGLLTNLVRRYEANIVISSTWRTGRNFGDMHDLFKVAGFNTLAQSLMFSRTDEEIWRTPLLSGKIRGIEIDQWWNTYAKQEDNYVILDDDSDMLPKHKEHFVKCNGRDGILYEQYMKCCHVFEGKLLSQFNIKDY